MWKWLGSTKCVQLLERHSTKLAEKGWQLALNPVGAVRGLSQRRVFDEVECVPAETRPTILDFPPYLNFHQAVPALQTFLVKHASSLHQTPPLAVLYARAYWKPMFSCLACPSIKRRNLYAFPRAALQGMSATHSVAQFLTHHV